MMNLRILVVDDNRATGLYLRQIIEAVPGVTVVAVAVSGQEGLQKAREHEPQAVFLDVDMPGMNGLELAQALLKWWSETILVFATAYPDYALQAFELYSLDYILKPFDEDRVKQTVLKLKEQLQSLTVVGTPEATIMIEENGRRIFLKPSEILYVESIKPQIHIRTRRDDFLFRHSLRALGKELSKYGFFQSHRSYLVNLQYIRQIVHSGKTFEILLDSNEKVMLSRLQEAKLRKLLHR